MDYSVPISIIMQVRLTSLVVLRYFFTLLVSFGLFPTVTNCKIQHKI